MFLTAKIILVLSMLSFLVSFSSATATALDCKSVSKSLQAEEKLGKATHKAFMAAFLTFQKNRFNEATYWKAFKLKYSLVKSDVKSGELASINAYCFNATQVSFINSYTRDRKKMLSDLTEYLSNPPNTEWIYSGYAGYVSLNYSLKGYR